MKHNRSFGRIVIPDERDKKFALRRAKPVQQSRSWRLQETQDQGEVSSCVGHAWVHWLMASPTRNLWLNGDGVYQIAQFVDEWPHEDYEGTSVRAGAQVIRALGYVDSFHWSPGIETDVATIINEGPMVVGTDWYEGMMETDRYGLVHPTGRIVGGHAYLLYGADLRRERFKGLCAWPDFGDNGRFEITFDDYEKLRDDLSEACIAREVKVK